MEVEMAAEIAGGGTGETTGDKREVEGKGG